MENNNITRSVDRKTFAIGVLLILAILVFLTKLSINSTIVGSIALGLGIIYLLLFIARIRNIGWSIWRIFLLGVPLINLLFLASLFLKEGKKSNENFA